MDCGDGMTVMRRYRNCVKRRCGKKSPRWEALTQGKASHFCRRKFCKQNFMQARGSLGTRLTIFVSLCASTMRQGEATKRLTIFADFCNSKNRVKESRAKKRAPLIRRRAATPFPPRGRLKTLLTEVAFSDSFPDEEAERAV